MSGGPFGLLIAFVAGLVSCLSPCVLPLVPIYVSHLGTTGSGATVAARRAVTLRHAAAFVAGFTAVFVLLGVSLGLVGSLLQAHLQLLQRLSGLVMIVMGLYFSGLLPLPWLMRNVPSDVAPGRGYVRSFSVGTMLSLGWTSLHRTDTGSHSDSGRGVAHGARGGYLLLAYSLGLGIPFLLTALAVTPLQQLLAGFGRWPHRRNCGRRRSDRCWNPHFNGLLTQLNSYFQFNGLGPRL